MRKLLILVVLLMCGSVYVFAGPEEFTFLGWNDGNWQNGYPYFITENGGGNDAIIDAMCDDYVHGGMPGDQWDANITDLGSNNIQLTRFNNLAGPNALYPLMLYDEAGWLLLETQDFSNSNWMEMNSAVWNIFDPAAPCDSTCQQWLTAAQNEAKIGFPGVDFNQVYIVTPVNQHDPDPNSMQEFMYIGQDPAGSQQGQTTPEPGTLVLMGTGVLALFGRKFLN
jgi:hypothetical protein